MFHVNRYRMLEVRTAMRRERIFRNRTNPLEIYDDLELFERFRFDRRTILQIAQLLQDDLESSTFRNKAIHPLINEKTKIQTRQYIYSSNTGIWTSIPCKLISYFNFNISRANLFFSMFSFCFFSFSFSISRFIFSFVYVCNFLSCPIFVPRSYRRGKLCFQNNFSHLVQLQQQNFFLYLSNLASVQTFFYIFKSHEQQHSIKHNQS